MSRFKDEKGIFKKTPQPTANPPLGAEPLEKIEYTTPNRKVTIEKLEEKQRSSQRLTLIERQILLAHEAKKRDISETSTLGKLKESSTRIQQPIFEQIFPQKMKQEEEIETLD